jgi:hypothetical protein
MEARSVVVVFSKVSQAAVTNPLPIYLNEAGNLPIATDFCSNHFPKGSDAAGNWMDSGIKRVVPRGLCASLLSDAGSQVGIDLQDVVLDPVAQFAVKVDHLLRARVLIFENTRTLRHFGPEQFMLFAIELGGRAAIPVHAGFLKLKMLVGVVLGEAENSRNHFSPQPGSDCIVQAIELVDDFLVLLIDLLETGGVFFVPLKKHEICRVGLLYQLPCFRRKPGRLESMM